MEEKLNLLRNLLILSLLLILVLAGVSIRLLQQVDQNRAALAAMRSEAKNAVSQFMPELDQRLKKFEGRLDEVETQMNGLDARFQRAEDHMVARLDKELPGMIDRYMERKMEELRRMPPIPRR